MPSLDQLRAKTAANAANSQMQQAAPPPTITPENLVQIPAAAPLDLPVMMPQRGAFPTGMVFDSDRSDNTRVFRGPNTRSAVFQNPRQPVATPATVVAASASALATALQIMVQNQLVPNQEILNFIPVGGLTISAGPDGQIILTVTAGGTDGLTHGRLPWPGDPSSVILVDDFHANLTGAVNGSNIFVGLGQLGWQLQGGSNAPEAGFFGGSGLHIGNFAWENSATVSGFGMLNLAPLNGPLANPQHSPGTWALAENPGSVTSFVFKLDADTGNTSPNLFSTAQKSMYVGFTGPAFFMNIQSTFSRPDVFIGVRYDTSPAIGPLTLTSVAAGTGVYSGTITNGGSNAFAGYTFTIAGFASSANNGSFLCTASTSTTLTLVNASSVLETHAGTATRPAIGDSFFTLEVVNNPTYNPVGRNNTQGTTLVTNVAPVAGQWHRLDVYFNQTGKVTLTLDGSATNTLTTSMPVSNITGTITGQVQNQKGLVSWSVGTTLPDPPWNDGSLVTISGFTSGRAVLNGAQTLTGCLGSSGTGRFTFNLGTANVGSSSDTVTLSGYPSLTPVMMFGNDDNPSTPTQQNMTFFVDYFSFVQNANLGPSAPGSVVVGNSRYF